MSVSTQENNQINQAVKNPSYFYELRKMLASSLVINLYLYGGRGKENQLF